MCDFKALPEFCCINNLECHTCVRRFDDYPGYSFYDCVVVKGPDVLLVAAFSSKRKNLISGFCRTNSEPLWQTLPLAAKCATSMRKYIEILKAYNPPLEEPLVEPTNNQGRPRCYWCRKPTAERMGFTDVYNICTHCEK